MILHQAYQANPERFVNGPPKLPPLPGAVWINPPRSDNDASEASFINSSTSVSQNR